MRSITVLVAITMCARLAQAVDPPATEPTSRPIAQISAEELIDSLTAITNQEFSVRTNIFAGDQLPQGLLRLHEKGPNPVQAQQELVRRGVGSLPHLLRHLDDARQTKASIKGMFGGINFSAEYDWVRRGGKTRPKGIVGNFSSHTEVEIVGRPEGNEYLVTVGDLCFNMIGDIVNRRYDAVRYQPTAIIVVNSPVYCPALRSAVRSEWSDLTLEKHRASLVEDVVHPDCLNRDAAGIQLLFHYYPQAAGEAARRRLSMPVCDFFAVRDFAPQLYVMGDEAEVKKRIQGYISEKGDLFRDALILQLWHDKFYETGQTLSSADSRKVTTAPREILKSMIGEFDDDFPPVFDPAATGSLDTFISALGSVKSPEIDQAVWDIFLKNAHSHADSLDESDRTAKSAVLHLAHKGHDAELLAYCNRRLRELAQHGEYDFERQSMGQLVRLLSQSFSPQ